MVGLHRLILYAGNVLREQLLEWLEGFNPWECRAIALERAAGPREPNDPLHQEQLPRLRSQGNDVQDGSHANPYGLTSASLLMR